MHRGVKIVLSKSAGSLDLQRSLIFINFNEENCITRMSNEVRLLAIDVKLVCKVPSRVS
jgi:hypothetical protein